MLETLSVIGTILLVLIGIVVLFLLCLFSKVMFSAIFFVLEFIVENIRYVILGIIILMILWAIITNWISYCLTNGSLRNRLSNALRIFFQQFLGKVLCIVKTFGVFAKEMGNSLKRGGGWCRRGGGNFVGVNCGGELGVEYVMKISNVGNLKYDQLKFNYYENYNWSAFWWSVSPYRPN